MNSGHRHLFTPYFSILVLSEAAKVRDFYLGNNTLGLTVLRVMLKHESREVSLRRKTSNCVVDAFRMVLSKFGCRDEFK